MSKKKKWTSAEMSKVVDDAISRARRNNNRDLRDMIKICNTRTGWVVDITESKRVGLEYDKDSILRLSVDYEVSDYIIGGEKKRFVLRFTLDQLYDMAEGLRQQMQGELDKLEGNRDE